RRKLVKESAPRARKGIYELTGAMACGGCRKGATLNAAVRKKQAISGFAYRCGSRARTAGHACEGVYMKRHEVESEVRQFLEVHARGIDESPAAEVQRAHESDAARKRADKQRTALEKDHKRLTVALARLAVDKNVNPENYEEDVYELAVAELKRDRDKIARQLQQATVVVEQPAFGDFRPLVVGLMAEWDTLLTAERNAIIRKLVRRVALVKTPEGEVRVEIHPIWMPDPWAKESVSAAHDLAA
ncbi:hypothetical protein ABZ885_31385, partial [Kitasatospora sp. NPDC047058]